MNDGLQNLLKEIDIYNNEKEKLKNRDSEGDQLLYRLCYNQPKTKEEWFELHEQVHDFLKKDKPENQKQSVMQYTEMLAMIISGYENMEK